eukprot:gnl/TRDRNA2_/TRDRNA2_51026_c0_seq1.p3 gnl/TRDRNA2_/TRDRNA2_51026_c0~~gnl/TRDRNA2_/TRDRNA2_51026_c0_seq1.p3  ORF type:complete len:111 (+),score=15.27 gnl/TRDRNA2_/TRDRNA2_51026_c0_seq1:16-348(+)
MPPHASMPAQRAWHFAADTSQVVSARKPSIQDAFADEFQTVRRRTGKHRRFTTKTFPELTPASVAPRRRVQAPEAPLRTARQASPTLEHTAIACSIVANVAWGTALPSRS